LAAIKKGRIILSRGFGGILAGVFVVKTGRIAGENSVRLYYFTKISYKFSWVINLSFFILINIYSVDNLRKYYLVSHYRKFSICHA